MIMGDFTTAVANELPITVILLDNAKLAMIEHKQDKAGTIFYYRLHRIEIAR